jgi:hypothetical protein
MPATATTSAEVGVESRQVAGDPWDTLAVASTEGNVSEGTIAEWLESMRSYRDRCKREQNWIGRVSILAEVCKDLLLARPWVKEVAVRASDSPPSLMLYVVTTDENEITLDHRRAVACFGLALGGALEARSEARITSQRPVNFSFIV